MSELKMEILSPQGVVFKRNVLLASFPTLNGIITVLPGHVNLMTKLCSGEIIIKCTADCIRKITVTSGFIEITNDNINIIAEFAAHSDTKNRQKIDKAIKLANDIKNRRKEFSDVSVVDLQLKKSVVELKSDLGHKLKKI